MWRDEGGSGAGRRGILWGADGSVPQAHHPPRRRPHRALLLAGALIYTSFSASSEATTPSQLLERAATGKTYELTGKVADGSAGRTRGAVHVFRVRDRDGHALGAGPLHAARCPTRSARGARSSSTSASRAARLRRREGLAGHQVPVEVHEPSTPTLSVHVLTAGRACSSWRWRSRSTASARRSYGARTRQPARWVDSGRRAVYALAGVLIVAFALLEAAFLRSDFSFELVATHSSTTTPPFYRATAIWSSQEGSLLLWVMLLALWSSLVLFLTRRRAARDRPVRDRRPAAASRAFFVALLVFLESPVRGAGARCRPRASASTRCCATRA